MKRDAPLDALKGTAESDQHITSPSQLAGLNSIAQSELELVAQKFKFRVPQSYLRLINWDDPNDPIRQLVIPRTDEINDWGILDASKELATTVVPALQHKYPDTALLLSNSVCAGYCRYCFRKRLFMDGNEEVPSDFSAAFEYISDHPEINNVILSGGDPLSLSTRRLRDILYKLAEIPHIRIIRLGTKVPAFNPESILRNTSLLDLIQEISSAQKRIFIMAHFDHPRELTPEAVEAIDALINCRAICFNQCPLIKGVNNDPLVLKELFEQLSFIGCPQYYVFQCRPTQGNLPYVTSIVEGYKTFLNASRHLSGVGSMARYCLSHQSGKIEVVGLDEDFLYLRYHRAQLESDLHKLIICERNDQARWFDELQVINK